MLGKLKEGASKAGLEADYLKRKASKDFHHTGETGEAVLQLRTTETATVRFKENLSTVVSTLKHSNEAYRNSGSDFSFISDQTKNDYLRKIGKLYSSLDECRKKYYDALNVLQNEINNFIGNDLKRVISAEDATNRALTEREYYKNDKKEKTPSEEKYKNACSDLVVLIREIHSKALENFEKWSQQIVEAEIIFHAAASEKANEFN